MSHTTTLGIDLAKKVFQLHGVDQAGNVSLKKRLSRAKFAGFVANLPPLLIGMEACGSAHYWARKFASYGHTVRLIAPQFVKPYVKSNKNDQADAAAICEAVGRPHMRFVPIKQIEHQDMQMRHRIRSLAIKQRTSLANQIRGLLGEHGIIVKKGINHVRNGLGPIIDDEANTLSEDARIMFTDLLAQFHDLDKKIKGYDQ